METFNLLAVTGSIAALIAAACLAVGAIATWVIQAAMGRSRLKIAQAQAQTIVEQSEEKAQNITKTAHLEAKAEKIQQREEFDRESAQVRNELRETERHLAKREDVVDRKWENITQKEQDIDAQQKQLVQKEKNLASKDEQLSRTLAEQRAQLLRVSGISVEQARDLLLERIENEVTHEASSLIERIVSTAQEEAHARSREITLNAIQRYAATHTCDGTVSTVDIPSDDMKGRVIGREGRNIRAFEKSTGVDVIIDDTPGVVVVSAFDPVRREVARISLDKLIADGRIHPARIEEIVKETQAEMDAKILDLGKKVTLETNVNGLSGKFLPYLGRLHYRTSFGQNVLRHSIEVAFLCQTMAEELGLDGDLARRCGLLHDIGKAADHEIEGSHPAIGADIVKRLGERPEVVNAVAGHHGDVPPTSPYAVLVSAADAMSASRPGARRETLERYVKRLENLENIACEFDGVKQAYAIQAGREIRVIVDPKRVDDANAWKTARDIAEKVEKELTYPGEVKVTLLREVRCIEFAR